LIDFLAAHRTRISTAGTNLDKKRIKGIIKKKLVHELGLFIHRGWARVLIDRARTIVERPARGGEDVTDEESEEEGTYQADFVLQQDLILQRMTSEQNQASNWDNAIDW
jgi:hypothetical protein